MAKLLKPILMPRLTIYFFLLYLAPYFGFSQFPNYFDNAVEQTPTLLYNSIASLRAAGISMISDGMGTEYSIIHTTQSTNITYVSVFYTPIYCDPDTCDSYVIIDSVKTPKNIHEDHYFTNGLLTSSFYYSQYKDSVKVDTSSIVHYFYEDRNIIKTIQTFLWWEPFIKENLYFNTGNRLDSIHEYSNAISSTFRTEYSDTITLKQKVRYTYDNMGRPINKERYIRSFSRELATFTHPNSSRVVMTQTPYHPIRGCIIDNSISFSQMVVLEYSANGLVKKIETYFRSKSENEGWNNGKPSIYNLKYY